MKLPKLTSLIIAALVAANAPAIAQNRGLSKAAPAPAEPGLIALGTGGVANMPAESWYEQDGLHVRNVSRAGLTPFLPAKDTATGAAVIVVPGGAFMQLAIEKEGWRIAQWLADHGIAAFVLKYRLRPTPADAAEAEAQARAMFRSGRPFDPSVPDQSREDVVAALQLVRARSGEWGVDPKRVGLMGFSAGAMATLGVTIASTSADMPAFIAPIYGPMGPVQVPAAAPPLFAALAADDAVFAKQGFGLIGSWHEAGKPVEFHLFQRGGHGYGSGKPGTTTTGWLEGFRRWLDVNGLLGGQL